MNNLKQFLKTDSLGRQHRHFPTTESTNDRAWDWIEQNAPHGALVTADQQTNGRGRLGRTWQSPNRDGIYASLVVRSPSDAKDLGAMGLAIAVGIRQGLLPWTDSVQYKWPNDLLVQQKKLAGILCESKWSKAGAVVVAGFGINLQHQHLSIDLQESATSLSQTVTTTSKLLPDEILASILDQLETTLEQFLAHGFPAIREHYQAYCSGLHERILVSTGTSEKQWMLAKGLAENGALLVQPIEGGPVQALTSAEIGFPPAKDNAISPNGANS